MVYHNISGDTFQFLTPAFEADRLPLMIHLLLLSIFVLAFGVMGSTLALSGVLWLGERKRSMLKTFFFLAYLSSLFFLSGIRYGLMVFGTWDIEFIRYVSGILERIAYASLIYFLPATINYILVRAWTAIRLTRVLLAAIVYLAAGIVSLVTGNALLPGILAALAFLLILLFVLTDALRSLPLVEDERTRFALFLLYGLTFLFLPLAQLLPLVLPIPERSLFLAGSLYVLALGATADLFLLRLLIAVPRPTDSDDADIFLNACRLSELTDRECEIAALISRGLSYKEIAVELGISPNTVSSHVVTIYRKTGTRSKVEMVNALRRKSLVMHLH